MSPTLGRRLTEAAGVLSEISESPRLDAELLLAHALGLTRSQLLARLHTTAAASGFDALLERRLAHEPVAYILGEWEFFSLPLYVEAPILVPRPETEHLVEAVLDFIGNSPARVLDLCTGSGCVALAIAKNAPQCRVTATDRNPQALALAQQNAARLGVEDRVVFRLGDLFGALTESSGAFNAICANPPYVEDGAWDELAPDIRDYEDPRALLAGPEGLDLIDRIAREAGAWLEPGGFLALEIGMGQYSSVGGLLSGYGFTRIDSRRDLAGIDRIVTARAPFRVEG
ncbi:MAG: peptide chain release factor N(5)-glutamine methyltransferase [FCB group bacterium]|jgi:release factor glutamine methyltransferase|nr:peptide chain release factor N(5)-glutamine methyltransferase [FCB group bacterium]